MKVFDEATAAFLASGCALIIGTVDDHGQPHAGRGWGLDVIPSADGVSASVRLLLDADDDITVANVASRGAVAVTATSVRSLSSTQLKGRAISTEVVTLGDQARAERYREDFFADIFETDGTDPSLLARLTPAGHVACTIAVDEVFDQTPGPGAGAALSPGRS